MPGDKKQLGKILLTQRLVTPGELDELLVEQQTEPGLRLGSAALRAGHLTEVELLRALSEQHDVQGIDLAQVVVPSANLRLVPVDVARQSLILPVSVTENEILLAMADPTDRRVMDEIEFVTGRDVKPFVALHGQLKQVIEDAYRAMDRGEPHWIGDRAPPDYLASLGISPKGGARPPASPGVRKTTGAGGPPPPPSAHGRRLPTLDPAFDSRVAPLPKEEVAAALKAPRGGRTVLIVDDEEDIRRMLRRVLEGRKMTVLEAEKGTEALQLVRDHMPNLILLDAMLPEIHGFDICRRIKGSQKYGHIPIIMVSAIYRGWRFAEDLKQSYGVEAFLEKPFKISEVVAAAERALEGKSLETTEEDEELSDSASEALSAGIDAYKGGDLDRAIEHLLRGVGIDPLSFRLHYHLGLLYGRRDNLFEAIHEMEAAVDLQPRNFAALKNLAVLYQRAGFKHKAIEIWERALGSAPDEETKKGIKDHLMSLL